MRHRTKAPAFTLIETLIALVIIVMVLGSSLVAGRAILASAQRSSDLAQMNMLADESIDNLQLFRNSIQTNAIPTDTLRASLGIASGSVVKGAFYAIPGSTQTVQTQGALTTGWCAYTGTGATIDSTKKCSTVSPISPIGIDRGGAGISCGNASTNTNCQLTALLDNASVNGELIAVRRTGHALPADDSESCNGVNQQSTRTIVDASSPITGSLATCLYTSQSADWDFYVRTIQLTQISCAIADLPGCPASLGNSYFQATVTVKNFYNKTNSVTKTINLTDVDYSKIKYN